LPIAVGNRLLSMLIDHGGHYAGSFFDTPFFVSAVWFTYLAGFGPALQPHDDPRPNREVKQSLWTARIAMLAVLTLPLIAFVGYYEKGIPPASTAFRLRLVFAAMFLIGTLAFWKLIAVAGTRSSCEPLRQSKIYKGCRIESRSRRSWPWARWRLGLLMKSATRLRPFLAIRNCWRISQLFHLGISGAPKRSRFRCVTRTPP
jgi:hypothetical protein